MLTLTYTNKHTQKIRKINLNRFFTSLLILTLIIACMGLYVDFVRFPDKYITTWKYQLKNEIASGDQKAIDYYNRGYANRKLKPFDNKGEHGTIELVTFELVEVKEND